MTRSTRTILAPRTSLAAVALAFLALGCGGGSGYRLSGKVTFKGQPIPTGKIYFNPDGSKGNSGPTGYADIKDGEYDTALPGGRGVTGGPMIVSIEGFDPNAKGTKDKEDKSGEVLIKTLFPRYDTPVDLPKSNGDKDFDVPGDAATRPVQKGPVQIIP